MTALASNLKARGRYSKPTKASCVRDWSNIPQTQASLGSRIVARDVLIVSVSGAFFGNVRGSGKVVGKANLVVRKNAKGTYVQVGL